MGTFDSFRKAYGALKDSTKVGLAKVNSEYKDLDIAVVKATNHVEGPPKERHVRKIFSATSAAQPRADVAYCIHALARRLSKTRNWVVALKTLIVIHRTLREGDPSFREELVNFPGRPHILQISNFKDDSSPLAWDCSAWLRTYALFLEERIECFRILKYDIESERLTKISPGATKAHSRTRLLSREELLEQLPALQQLLHRLIGCQPEGAACYNYLIQYALALVLKESFKIYCGINDGIINLVDMFFEMPRHDAVKALNIYKRAGQQAENLANFYEFCKALDLSRNFQFPTLRQPPPSFLATMEEYIKEAPQSGSMSNKKLEYQEKSETLLNPEEPEEPPEPVSPKPEEPANEKVQEDKPSEDTPEEPQAKEETEPAPLITADDVGDLLGLNETNPKALELEHANALALAIVQPGNDPLSTNQGLNYFGANSSGWELALVTTPTNNNNQMVERKLAGGLDKLLLDSLYEDDHARRQLQLQNAGYGYDTSMQYPSYAQPDPFAVSNNIAPPSNVQFAMMQQQQQQQMMFQNQHQHQQQQQYQMTMYQNQQQFPQHNMMMVPHGQPQYNHQYLQQQQMPQMDRSNPFSDPFTLPTNTVKHPGGHHLL